MKKTLMFHNIRQLQGFFLTCIFKIQANEGYNNK